MKCPSDKNLVGSRSKLSTSLKLLTSQKYPKSMLSNVAHTHILEFGSQWSHVTFKKNQRSHPFSTKYKRQTQMEKLDSIQNTVFNTTKNAKHQPCQCIPDAVVNQQHLEVINVTVMFVMCHLGADVNCNKLFKDLHFKSN